MELNHEGERACDGRVGAVLWRRACRGDDKAHTRRRHRRKQKTRRGGNIENIRKAALTAAARSSGNMQTA